MNAKSLTIWLAIALQALPAQAGFRDPTGGSGERAQEIALPTRASAYSSATAAGSTPTSTTANRSPASTLKAAAGNKLPAPAAPPGRQPIPSAPALPGAANTKIPEMRLPNKPVGNYTRDSLAPIPEIGRAHV